MKNVKKLMEAYSKQYEEDSIYLCVENDVIYITKVNYITSSDEIYMDVIEIKNNHVTKYNKYFNKEKLLGFVEINVCY